MRFLLPLLAATALTACASQPTIYAPAGVSDRGYSERQIEGDRFRIRFEAGGDISMAEAEDLALRRAAEITLLEDGDWFLVVSRRLEGDDRDPVRVGGSVSQTFGSGGYRGTGVGIGVRIDPSAGEKTVTLEILVRNELEHGPAPRASDAYRASEVLGIEGGL